MKLHEMTIADACRHKWIEGRAVYGGDAFRGDPLEELYAELIDAINYAEEAERRKQLHAPGIVMELSHMTYHLRQHLIGRKP